MKYIKKEIKFKIILIIYILILIAIPLNTRSASLALKNYDSSDKENHYPSNTFITTVNGKKYLAEYITRENVEEKIKGSELRDPNKDNNQIIDGHGTGYAPPKPEELEKLIGKVSILGIIQEESSPNYGASADFSTENYFPVVGDQAWQGSCSAWANTYYAYGYMEAKDYGWDASSGNSDYLLSPAWVYNKVAAYDYGSDPIEVAEIMMEWGVSTLSTMPYRDLDVISWGEEDAWREAPYHRPLTYNPITFTGSTTIDLIKSLLDSETPVTIGIDAYQFDPGFADGNYIVSSAEYVYSAYSLNHAQCFVGYDDSITDDGDVGAFRVVNSWGVEWGDSGYYWLTYDAFSEFGDDPYQIILYLADRIDYNPSLIGTWEFSDTPTRMDDIITLGAGPHDSPLDTITPLYDNDVENSFPEFMSLDISDFQTYYTMDPDVFFFLDIGSSLKNGTISSFKIERYVGGSLVEISPESLDTPAINPGHVNCTFKVFDHELKVALELPSNPKVGYVYPIKATVINIGLNVETGVDLYFSIDGVLEDSTTGLSLSVGESESINYMWIANEIKLFTFNAYSPPVTGETYISNNNKTIQLNLTSLRNYIMIPGYTYSWIDASGGTELILTDDDYDTIALPFSFTFYDQAFSTIYLGANGYLSFTDSSPSDYSNDPIPSSDTDNYYLIAPFWDDIYPPDGGHIYVQSFGTYWVAEWLNIYHISDNLLGSFEVVLYDTGEIVFNYDYLDYIDPYDGYTCGLNYGVDTDYYNSYQGLSASTDNFAIQFYQGTLDLTHDLCVMMEVPESPEIGITYVINATVFNTGNNVENDVDLVLEFDEVLVNSTSISILSIGESETITYEWIPTEYKDGYNFTAMVTPVSGETFLENNIATELLSIVVVHLFDNMYIDYNYDEPGYSSDWTFRYQYYSGDLFNNLFVWWDMGYLVCQVDSNTRIETGSIFGDNVHTPIWIFTHVSLGDDVLIAVGNVLYSIVGDQIFTITDEGTFDLPNSDTVDVWVLEGVTEPGTSALYEKNTGILMTGTFYSAGLSYQLSYNDTNVDFAYPPGTFTLSSTAGDPDDDGNFDLTWDRSDWASDYTVYESSSYVTEIDENVTPLIEGTTDLEFSCSGYDNGTYFFIVRAMNEYGEILSNCYEVNVSIPPAGEEEEEGGGTRGIPGYSIYILIASMALISIIIWKKRTQQIKNI